MIKSEQRTVYSIVCAVCGEQAEPNPDRGNWWLEREHAEVWAGECDEVLRYINDLGDYVCDNDKKMCWDWCPLCEDEYIVQGGGPCKACVKEAKGDD